MSGADAARLPPMPARARPRRGETADSCARRLAATISAVIDGTEETTRKTLDAVEAGMASANAGPARPAR